MAPIRTIAFVGLGNMGMPMAAQLAAAGFSLALHDTRSDVVRAFADAHGGPRSRLIGMTRAGKTKT